MEKNTVCALLCAAALAGCTAGPDYKKPETRVPDAFKETGPWKTAIPKDALPKGAWWAIYGDAGLDALEKVALAANPTVEAAFSCMEQARAVARVSEADFYPSVNAGAGASRVDYSGNRPIQPGSRRTNYTTNSFGVGLALNYELDFAGRVSRAAEGALATAQARQAAYQNTLLLLQAEVAQTYFAIRTLGVERDVVVRGIKTRSQALDLTRERLKDGAANENDVRQAETELSLAQADAVAIRSRRAQLLHALAALCGKLPSEFDLPKGRLPAAAPAVPTGLPSELLERRPDVAEAERTMAAACAEIGVAKAAFYPSVRLAASADFGSDALSSLTNWESKEWGFGPVVSIPLFQGGRLEANEERAKAKYKEAVADYRGRVLTAFREVEDGIAAAGFLGEQAGFLGEAVVSSRKAADLSLLRYRAGIVSYYEVVNAERIAIQAELAMAQTRGVQLATHVQLVKALGGGWEEKKPGK